MKIFQLAALFGGAASAAQPLVGRDDGTTTTVVYTTSTYTITKCAASVTNCPVASATEVFTSTTVMSITTTICPVTSTPGLQPPGSGYVPSFVPSSVVPASSPGMTGTLSDSDPTTYLPAVSGSSGAYVPSTQSSALPVGPSQSIAFSVSLISPYPSLPVTESLSDSVPTSFPPDVFGSSSVYPLPAQSSAQPTSPPGSESVVVPRLSSSDLTSLPLVTGTLPDSVPTSLPSGVSASGSSIGYIPPQQSTTAEPASSLFTTGTNTGAVPTSNVTPSSGYGQSSVPSNTATDAVPTSGYPASSAIPSSGAYSPSVSSDTATGSVPASGYPGSSAAPSNSHSPSVSGNTATDAVPTSGYAVFSGYGSASSSGPFGTNTDAVPTSSGPGTSGTPSSVYTAPGSTALPTPGYPSGSITVMPSSGLSTVSGTRPALTSTGPSSVYEGPPPPALSNTTVVDGTTRITSHMTQTSTHFVTMPLPSSNPSTNTATDAVPTSRGTGYLPSGSGYPYPSGTANGTIVAPTPSYIEVPVNMGQMVAVGQGPIAAIVIALAFVLFA